ncbi:unnamed protein product [Cuscuta epithymum]|uniref:Ribosomal protein L28 n=1 Tax=Cuscuta epithymum TaxID=186058 RepID=A0AAV0F7I3_9ASTE|nr:unnamed protein product [Cuscuta epithymum]
MVQYHYKSPLESKVELKFDCKSASHNFNQSNPNQMCFHKFNISSLHVNLSTQSPWIHLVSRVHSKRKARHLTKKTSILTTRFKSQNADRHFPLEICFNRIQAIVAAKTKEDFLKKKIQLQTH